MHRLHPTTIAPENTIVRIEQDSGSTKRVARIALVVTMMIVIQFVVQRHALAAPAPVPHALPSPSRIETHLNAQGNTGVIDRIFQRGMAEFNDGNHEAAINFWELAAQQGHLYAQYNLGIAYANGIGARTDISLAIHWWRQAANQGSTDAQYNLGILYAEGNGVEKDIVEASIWWRLAAQGGDAAAQYNLGLLLARGDGIQQDIEGAIQWWQESAAQGFEQAIRVLEMLKERGVSVNSSQR